MDQWCKFGSSNSNLKHPYLCGNVNNHLHCRFYRKFPNQREFNESESTSLRFGYSFVCFVLFFLLPTYLIVYAFSFLKVLHPVCQCVPFKFRCWPSCPQSERGSFWVVLGGAGLCFFFLFFFCARDLWAEHCPNSEVMYAGRVREPLSGEA